MRIQIEPFRRRHVREAVQLLAARQRRGRKLDARLPAAFEDEKTAALALKEAGARWGSRGVAAVANGRLQGYLIGTREDPAISPREPGEGAAGRASVRVAGHALNGTGAYELYGSMYAALAAAWLEAGCSTHVVDILAADQPALDAWFSLGFGQQSVIGARDTGTVPGGGISPGVEIRRAGPADIGSAVHFARSLRRYHLEAPMFFREDAGEGQLHAVLAARLLDDWSPIWIAWRGSRAVGMISVGASPITDPLACPDRCLSIYLCFTEPDARGPGVALLRQALGWGRERGVASCTSAWQAANLLSARTCVALGFRPLMYRLSRVIQP